MVNDSVDELSKKKSQIYLPWFEFPVILIALGSNAFATYRYQMPILPIRVIKLTW